MKTKLINPFFFVVKLPMPDHPFLGRIHRDVSPFLQILRNGQCRKRFAGVALNPDNLG
jgi:hypothetical protein